MAAIKIDWTLYTDKQRAAIIGFIRHGNKLKAYREAYKCDEQLLRTTKRACYNFFRKPKIKMVIEQIQEEAVLIANIQLEDAVEGSYNDLLAKKKEEQSITVDAAWVLTRAVMLAEFNIGKFIKTDNHGNAVYDFTDATDDDWYCIQEYTCEEIERGGSDDKYFVDKLKIKGYDKLGALKLVGQHVEIQAFRENFGISNPTGGPVELTDVSDEVLKEKLLELGIGKGSQLDTKVVE